MLLGKFLYLLKFKSGYEIYKIYMEHRILVVKVKKLLYPGLRFEFQTMEFFVDWALQEVHVSIMKKTIY